MSRLDVSAVKRAPEYPTPAPKRRATKKTAAKPVPGSMITANDLAQIKKDIMGDVSVMQAEQVAREQALREENDRLAAKIALLEAQASSKTAPLPSKDNETTPTAAAPLPADSAASRMEIVMRGAKQGAIKGAVDKTVGLISGPLTDTIVEKLLEANPKLAIAGDPIIRAVLNFAFIMGIAELLNYAGPLTGKEKMARKSELLSQWMRSYAGEKLGEEALEAAFQAVPLVMASFSDIKLEDLEFIVGNAESAEEELSEENTIPAIA